MKPIIKEYIPYEKTIVEHKAPTDDSIRLLNELREKTLQNIIDSIYVNNNVINFVGFILQDGMLLDGTDRIYAIFKIMINNMPYSDKFIIQKQNINNKSDFIRIIVSEISKVITKIMITKCSDIIDNCIENNNIKF